MAPGTLWLNPAGRPFSHRIRSLATTGRVTLDPMHLARLLEVPDLELTCHYGREDATLAHLVRALLSEASRETLRRAPSSRRAWPPRSGPTCSRTMSVALGRSRRARVAGSAGFAARRLIEHVESHLGEELALSRLAEVVGLSPYHLAREFKRATGETLHRYVVARRLERARDSLRRGGRRSRSWRGTSASRTRAT